MLHLGRRLGKKKPNKQKYKCATDGCYKGSSWRELWGEAPPTSSPSPGNGLQLGHLSIPALKDSPSRCVFGRMEAGRQVGSNSRPEDSLRLAATSLSKEAKGAPSYLQQAGSGDEATPLPTAQPQEAVALLVLPHADLQRGWRSGGGRGWEERVTFRCE